MTNPTETKVSTAESMSEEREALLKVYRSIQVQRKKVSSQSAKDQLGSINSIVVDRLRYLDFWLIKTSPIEEKED